MDASELRARADSVRDSDPAEAARLYAEASDLGSAGASSSLGYMHMVGEGVPRDPEKASLYLRRGADGGDLKAMCNLGNLIIEENPVEALGLFEKAAEHGSVSGMRNAATVLRTGAGVPADPERAVMWLSKAAETDVASMAVLAHILRTGEGVPADKPRAAELYRRAAEAGDADSMYDLAMMLDAGDGIPMDRAEAERWFRSSAELGDNDARLCLGGILYERSEFAEAESVFTDAALDGDVKGMYNLALMYAEGVLGERDMGKAEEWLESASEAGFAYAQTMLGTIYLDRNDVDGAVYLLRKAADQNEPTAMYNLGALALSGRVRMDDHEAVGFLIRAAEQGVEEARELLVRLSGQGML
ncbi:MAG: SEL1-like repeat protein [Thermoplasmata archaeon]|nr:SEL1-like repeat protein [Thermoplasmata archaeon]